MYGGTPAGVMAAAAARYGRGVALVDMRHAGGTAKLTVDERTEATPFNFTPLGEFTFKAGDSGFVETTNGNTDGRVVVEGMRWVWVGK